MGLSIPQMALMSQLLREALPLDTAGRRAWLESLSPNIGIWPSHYAKHCCQKRLRQRI